MFVFERVTGEMVFKCTGLRQLAGGGGASVSPARLARPHSPLCGGFLGVGLVACAANNVCETSFGVRGDGMRGESVCFLAKIDYCLHLKIQTASVGPAPLGKPSCRAM